MKLISFALVVGSLLVAAALVWYLFIKNRREGFSGQSYDLTSVDPKCTYDQTTDASPNRVVLYYADWCPHCTKFKPEFFVAAASAVTDGLDAAFLTVNVDKQAQGSDCMNYKGVSGFPTVLLERNGTSPPFMAYNGNRNAKDLVAWVKSALAK